MYKNILPNSEAHENGILVAPSGFREYDARWLYPEQVNLRGITLIGQALGTMLHRRGVRPDIVVGHDYRAYSASIKHALIIGLMAAGCRVRDIGLSLSPMAYFAQFNLDCPAVAMVTASHNENGWTGIKMGMEKVLTFGPDEMAYLRDLTLRGDVELRDGGSYEYIDDMKGRYLLDLSRRKSITRPLKAVVACGNGTAGAFAPEALRAAGCEVIEMDCKLDYTFPRCNPNPEDMQMLHALSKKVLAAGADIGFAFDGDGDRCGVVDNKGREIFADKVGVLLSRYLSSQYPDAVFIADVKSTGLYSSDDVLHKNGASVEYWKTGHSYIKRRVHEINALGGFEKSGHFFLAPPVGRGYDDAILAAIMICRMLDHHDGETMAQLRDGLPQTWGSPTMAPHCADESKYDIVEKVTAAYRLRQQKGERVAGKAIASLVTVNGVRIVLDDGSWGLVRASSNKPSLVVVVESPVSEARMKDIFKDIDMTLRQYAEVGEYDQKIA